MGKQLTLQIMENYPGKDLLSSNILEQYYDMLLRKKDGNGKGGYTDCPIRGRAEGATTAYGRLLALADNFEESVLRKQGVKDRPTNAIKLMSNFTAKPYTTWGTLWKQLTPYLKSANGGSWFRNEVDDVMALFKEGDFEDNKALSPMFLLGYSCQRRASKRKAQEISQKNNSNN